MCTLEQDGRKHDPPLVYEKDVIFQQPLSLAAETELALTTSFPASPAEQAWPKTKDFGHALKRGKIARNRRNLRASRREVFGHPSSSRLLPFIGARLPRKTWKNSAISTF
jgi:hypothetical protein